MPSIFDGIDMTDPCAVYPVLEKAYLELLTGKQRSRVRFDRREVHFAATDTDALQRKISELRMACEARQTGRRRRRAATAGFR